MPAQRMIAALVALAIAPSQFVALDEIDRTIVQDMRNASAYNFVGRRIKGYREPVCILTRRAARALHRAQRRLRPQGYGLKVYDCYRPTRAVAHFERWANNPGDQKMKREFYPREDKRTLFDAGYIAHRSGHSRGSTVDLTLVKLPLKAQPRWDGKLRSCIARKRRRFRDGSVDMGTAVDCLDPRSATFHPAIKGWARRNRLLLKRTMEAAGFDPYANEWWHFTLRDERYPDRYFDFPVSRKSLR
jgi:zinc D-Ala-D-Ala dipeptidase